jgi:hypothetical protein
MRYLRSYQFIFDSPKWLPNILFGVLCQLLPMIGPIVWLGYEFDVLEAKHRRGDEDDYPDFSFDRFVPYLVRGIWPFLVNLVMSLPLVLIMMVLWIGGVTLAAALTQGQGGAAVAVVFFLAFAFLLAGSLVLGVVLAPMYLRAGLSQDFASAFSLGFVRDFLGRTWKELILSQLFLMATSVPLVLLGMALFCVGLYPAAAVVGLAGHHLYYQLYELYLERGGDPIPLKEDGPVPPDDDAAPAADRPTGVQRDSPVIGVRRRRPGWPRDAE